MKDKKKIVVGVGGSSGSIYTSILLDKLAERDDVDVAVVMSDNARINWKIELPDIDPESYPFSYYKKNDFMSPIASGSAQYTSMVICPCSMGLLGRIAGGFSQDLMTRAADVMLKERRQLILIPRETPYNLIHLRNMTALTEAGAIICPATPSFYSKPSTIKEACATVVDRVIDLMGLPQDSYRWGE